MYTVDIPRTVQKQIDRLPADLGRRIYAALTALAANPRPHGALKMTGVARWRIRVGDYRVIYTINDVTVIVSIVKVGKRDNVYD